MNNIKFHGELRVVSFPIPDEDLLKKFPFDMILQKNIIDLRTQNNLVLSYYVERMPDSDPSFPYCTSRLSFQILPLPKPQNSKITIKKDNMEIEM